MRQHALFPIGSWLTAGAFALLIALATAATATMASAPAYADDSTSSVAASAAIVPDTTESTTASTDASEETSVEATESVESVESTESPEPADPAESAGTTESTEPSDESTSAEGTDASASATADGTATTSDAADASTKAATATTSEESDTTATDSVDDDVIEEIKPAIEDGYYSIRTKDDVSYAVDAPDESADAGTSAQTYQFNGADSQIFQFVYLGSGYYRIICKASGLTLGLSDAAGGKGTLVAQVSWDESTSQQWLLIPSSDGFFYLTNRLNGLRMDVQGGHAGNTVNIQVWASTTNNNGAGQLWRFSPAAEQTVADGVYAMESPSQSGVVLDVMGSGRDNDTNVATYRNNNDSNQKFKVTYVANGYYKIICYDSLKCLDVEGSATQPGTNVSQFDYHEQSNQLWEIRDAGDGTYYLISKLGDSNSLYLDVQGGTAGNGTNVWVWSKTTNNNGLGQRWKFERMVFDGWYVIKSLDDTNQVLDVVAESKKNGGNVTTYQYRGSANQIWHIVHSYGQYYTIVNANSSMALDLVAGGKTNGTNVTQWSRYTTDNQLWKITFDEDGSVMIQSKVSGLYLDVEGGHAGNTVNIQTWEKTTNNGGLGQMFQLSWAHWHPGDLMNVIESIVSPGHNDEDDRVYDPCYIVIHETDNPGATALNHHDRWAADDTYCVHYVADWTGDTYHCMPNDQIAWQVGSGNPYVLGIELCHATNQSDFNRVYEVGVEWAAWMLDAYGWDTNHLISHRICSETWGGSDHTDPDGYFLSYGKTWADFVYDVSQRLYAYR